MKVITKKNIPDITGVKRVVLGNEYIELQCIEGVLYLEKNMILEIAEE